MEEERRPRWAIALVEETRDHSAVVLDLVEERRLGGFSPHPGEQAR